MLSQSKEEKEFFAKQNNPTGEKKRFLNEEERVFLSQNHIERFTDRELLEKQTFYLHQINKSNNSIKNNVQFWFYATIILAAISFIIANK
jgi:hypothetical protein